MKPLDRLRQELLNLERHLAVAGLALLDADEVETADDVKMLLAAFGYRYKSMRDFLRDHGETARSLRQRHPVRSSFNMRLERGQA